MWRGGVQLVQVAAGGSFPRLGQMSTGFRMTSTQCPARVDIGSSRSEKLNENLVHSFPSLRCPLPYDTDVRMTQMVSVFDTHHSFATTVIHLMIVFLIMVTV